MTHKTSSKKNYDISASGEYFSERARVVVKFSDIAAFEFITERRADKFQLSPFKDLAMKYPGIKLLKMFKDDKKTLEKLRELTERASKLDPSYRPVNFDTYFYVEIDEGYNVHKLEELANELRSLPTVESAYVERPGPDPSVDPTDDPRFVNQGYLGPAPDGINAVYAWNVRGGDGTGQRIIDLEKGWTLNHEDLAYLGAGCIHGTIRDDSRSHGTAVLGIICAEDNSRGCIGIAPKISSISVVSSIGGGGTHADRVAQAISFVLVNDLLSFGDLLLIESQAEYYDSGQRMYGPVEIEDAVFAVIRLATALGIIVVEVGGNGRGVALGPGMNMDTYVNASNQRILKRDPANPDFRDSGAIMVSAATSTSPHTRCPFAPFGRRIDCYAWGENIETCFSNERGATNLYTSLFSGTSGAAPIIAGAALLVQGIAQASLGFRFSPRQMRGILSNVATGTSPAPSETTHIGVMPNLRAIIEADIINQAPDIYIRDFVGDSGEPHSGPISSSPDIILRPTAVGNPQGSFGAGSGTENRLDLSSTVENGQDNFIYVRVLNQGGTDATNVEVKVYWSEVATLVTPDLWHLIGSATIPNVPTGELLTVSPAIVWHADQIPSPGHYCFVGLIGNGRDPLPDPARFHEWEFFTRFIRENNNITWRNFNVENNYPAPYPDTPDGYISLKFVVSGAPDKARVMSLELLSKVPKDADVILETPLVADRLISEWLPNAKTDEKKGVILLPLKSTGRETLFESILPAKSHYRMRLLVRIPEELRKYGYSVSLRQVWEGMEVGRATWNLLPNSDGAGRESI